MKRFGFACVLMMGAVGCGQGGDVEGLEGFVCGVDGQTYTVEEASKRDHDVAHRGRCGEPMGCRAPTDCFAGDACDADVCVPVPSGCPCVGVFEPVCGTDGRTYINACEARCVDVGVVFDGMCRDDPCALIDCAPGYMCEQGQCVPTEECGSDRECEPDEICIDWPQEEPAYCVQVGCDSDEQCRPGERCVIDDLCLAPAVTGPCEAAIPRWFYNANAGSCEQFTYGGCGGNDNNFETRDECEAACRNDVPKLSIAPRAGHCEPDVFCPDGLFAPDIYAPVCGVDDVTYGNPCEAERAGVDIAYDGECILEVTCLNQGCPEGWTCDFCQISGGVARYICLSPLAGACLPPSN